MSERAWYGSLYWRIALGFILFLAAMLVAQAAVFVWLVVQSGGGLPVPPPADFAQLVAADLSSALQRDENLDLQQYLTDQYARSSRPLVVVMRDGRVFTTADGELPPGLVRMAQTRQGRGQPPGIERGGRPPRGRFFAFAPVVLQGRVLGTVVVLPNRPWFVVAREIGPILAVAAVALLLAGTALAALLIFGPAHRRLRALEEAAGRLGSGDYAARASEEGGDEIAAVAQAFNRMASDLETRREELAAADRARRQLLADVSHELMTPLTAVRGYVETLQLPDLSLDPAARARYLDIIDQETLRLERLIGDLVELARLEAGGGSLLVRETSTTDLFARVLARHEREARERGVALTRAVGPGAEIVRADPDRLEQALQNLAANALRHTPSGGSVNLGAAREGEAIVIEVRDTGEGIPPEHLPLVFERFYKVDAARAGKAGSGLGLSIVKAIVERHGGSISVGSRPGEGTLFRIVLPGAAAAPQAAAS